MKIECDTIRGTIKGKVINLKKYPSSITFIVSRKKGYIEVIAGKTGKDYWIIFPERRCGALLADPKEYLLNSANIDDLLNDENDGALIAQAYRQLAKYI